MSRDLRFAVWDGLRHRRFWVVGGVVAVLVATVVAVTVAVLHRAPRVTTGPGWSVAVSSLRPELSRAQAVTVGEEVLLLGGTGATAGSTDVTGGVAITLSTASVRDLAAPPFDHALEQVGAQLVDGNIVVVGNPCLGPDPGSSAGACQTSTQLQAAVYSIADDRWTSAPGPELAPLDPGTGTHLLTGVGSTVGAAGVALFSVDHTGQLVGYDPGTRRWTQAAPALRNQDVAVCAVGGTAVATTVNYLNQGIVTDTFPSTIVDGATETTGVVDYVQPQARTFNPGGGWSAPSALPAPSDSPTDALYDPACTDRTVLLPAFPDAGGSPDLWQLPLTAGTVPRRVVVPAHVDIASSWAHVVQGDRVVLWQIGQVYDVTTDTWTAITPPPPETDDLICLGTPGDTQRLIVRCHTRPAGRNDQTAKPSVVLTLTTAAAHR